MSRRLLVVDDALIIREMIKECASNDGWEIVGEAEDGQEAIKQYEKLRPDAVTLDMVMPNHDGMHALTGILKIDAEAKVCVVSALDQTKILKSAFKLGASDFVVKPFDKDALVETLGTLVPATTCS